MRITTLDWQRAKSQRVLENGKGPILYGVLFKYVQSLRGNENREGIVEFRDCSSSFELYKVVCFCS